MSNVVMFVSFNLVEGAATEDFLVAAEKAHKEFISKQKGYISWQQAIEGDKWVDLITWETIDDANNSMEASYANPVAREFFSFINPRTIETHIFTVMKNY